MAREIERKFLVNGDGWRPGALGVPYRQGYLAAGDGITVRARVAGGRAWLTIKGPAAAGARDEYEYPIPVADALEMLDRLSVGGQVEKVRHRVPFAGHTWEVDEFQGENAPLVVAEVELERIDEEITLPPWIGLEVTYDPRYTNAALARHPYSRWGKR